MRYPVLYMQDGQNLFDPDRAFIPGQHWRLDSAAEEAVAERTAEPMIIIGVDHAGPGRIEEYTPTRDKKRSAGGKATDYTRMLIEELKPLIDSGYRTKSDQTAIGGSSLGGLVSLYAGLTRPDVFKRIAAMSPSVWWDDRAILQSPRSIQRRAASADLGRCGRAGGEGHSPDARTLARSSAGERLERRRSGVLRGSAR